MSQPAHFPPPLQVERKPARASSSPTLICALIIIWVTPVLYLLSIPPVSFWCARQGISAPEGGPPHWLRLYSIPANWLYYHTPLHDPLDAYREWWARKLQPRGGKR